jgi:hypothetical protein
MKISFDAIGEKEIKEFKGGKGAFLVHMFSDQNNKIMKGKLQPGSSIGMHTHETNSEIVYILSGVGTMEFEDTKEKLYPGDCHYCPQGATHSLINEGEEDLIFFAVVPEHEN